MVNTDREVYSNSSEKSIVDTDSLEPILLFFRKDERGEKIGDARAEIFRRRYRA